MIEMIKQSKIPQYHHRIKQFNNIPIAVNYLRLKYQLMINVTENALVLVITCCIQPKTLLQHGNTYMYEEKKILAFQRLIG